MGNKVSAAEEQIEVSQTKAQKTKNAPISYLVK